MKNKAVKLIGGIILSAAAAGANAQIPGLGGIPGLSGIPGLDSLPSTLTILTAYPLATDPVGTLSSLGALGSSVVLEPQTLFSLGFGTGLPLVQDLVPIVGVLTTAPQTLPDFLLGGGTIVSPTLSAIPAIPLLTAPLPGL